VTREIYVIVISSLTKRAKVARSRIGLRQSQLAMEVSCLLLLESRLREMTILFYFLFLIHSSFFFAAIYLNKKWRSPHLSWSWRPSRTNWLVRLSSIPSRANFCYPGYRNDAT